MYERWANRSYHLLRPILGHRLSHWLSDLVPGLAIALACLGLYWLILGGPTKGTAEHRECGSGPYTWPC